ncbi:hypothetical protein VNO77_02464 [Canavalia gladiata]|uniref:Uncharacterized protein n=1 Tax=Canavalia gladiata TaxID=3824 RepID=A0AAN9R795_CANGL
MPDYKHGYTILSGGLRADIYLQSWGLLMEQYEVFNSRVDIGQGSCLSILPYFDQLFVMVSTSFESHGADIPVGASSQSRGRITMSGYRWPNLNTTVSLGLDSCSYFGCPSAPFVIFALLTEAKGECSLRCDLVQWMI